MLGKLPKENARKRPGLIYIPEDVVRHEQRIRENLLLRHKHVSFTLQTSRHILLPPLPTLCSKNVRHSFDIASAPDSSQTPSSETIISPTGAPIHILQQKLTCFQCKTSFPGMGHWSLSSRCSSMRIASKSETVVIVHQRPFVVML